MLREVHNPWVDCSIDDPNNRLAILNSICGEVMAARINYTTGDQKMTISMDESQTAKDLKLILIALNMGKPPNNVTPQLLFKKIKEALAQRLSQQSITLEDSLLLPGGHILSPEQWKILEKINEELINDFTIRREMMLRRCDCTVTAFKWKSDNDEEIKKRITETYNQKRHKLSTTPNVNLADALAARPSECDELVNSVISKKPTNCMIYVPAHGIANKGKEQIKQMEELHKYRIGAVPDRGGRPNEQPKPARESFSQQQFQRENPQRGRGRGGGGNVGGRGSGSGGGGGGRGGPPNLPQNTNRIQGAGWANTSGDRYSNNYQQRDNHQQNQYQGGSSGQQTQFYGGGGGQQRYQQRDNYQQNYGYQSNQEYQQNYNANQYYSNQQQSDNYSQSYDNKGGYQQQRQQRGGYHGGGHGSGGGRRY